MTDCGPRARIHLYGSEDEEGRRVGAPSHASPIGDELQFQSHPLEIGSPSRVDFVRRKVAALLPRPTTRLGQVGHGLVFFLLSVTIVAACAYGIGLLVDHHFGLTTTVRLSWFSSFWVQ
jgi:hypothetical protein